MKNKLISILLLIALIFCFIACDQNDDRDNNDEKHVHEYSIATCLNAATCECGKTSGSPLGHDYLDATCTKAKICKRCNISSGSPLGHDYVDATCTTPKLCERCGVIGGSALGHNFSNATCTTPQICIHCEEVTGVPVGHDYTEATCLLPKTCKLCEATEGSPLGHKYVDNACIRCQTVDPDSLPTPLEKLHVIDQSKSYSVVPNLSDTYGNSYVNSHCFGSIYWGSSGDGYAVYNLNQKYTTFNGSIVVPGNSTETGGCVQIFVDDILVYNVSNIGKETAKIDFSINVKSGTKLKIVKTGNPAGSGSGDVRCLAIVNAELIK